MKTLSVIFLSLTLFILSFQSQAQQNPGQKKLGNNAQVQHLTPSILHEDCIRKQFSIVFHILLDSTYSVGAATPATLAIMLNDINNKFKNICVSFTSCATYTLPNYTYSRRWIYNSAESAVTASSYLDKTINVYVVDSVIYPQGQVFPVGQNSTDGAGYTYFPTAANLAAPKKDVIVIEKSQLILNESALMCHLLGHFFGLRHTYDEINQGNPANPPPPATVLSHEFANGTNCDSGNAPFPHGDGFCDTEADPYPSLVTHDAMNNPYVRPYDNLMSQYVSNRCRFTLQQYNFMSNTITSLRMYLH